jgi:hypothetical protein
VFLGEDLLAWLVLAFGAALAVGNGLALVRPPRRGTDDLEAPMARPPLARSLLMIGLGLVAAIWGLATLVTGSSPQ